jgi:hypothetical protein
MLAELERNATPYRIQEPSAYVGTRLAEFP